MIKLKRVEKGVVVQDENQDTELEFFYGGTTDYYIGINALEDCVPREDGSLEFFVDKSNKGLYSVLNKFYKATVESSIKYSAKQRGMVIPGGMQFRIDWFTSGYDSEELYKDEKINWKSEAGNPDFIPNANTEVQISRYSGGLMFKFNNEVFAILNPIRSRSAAVCMSGSCSDLMPTLVTELHRNLENLSMINDKAKTKKQD